MDERIQLGAMYDCAENVNEDLHVGWDPVRALWNFRIPENAVASIKSDSPEMTPSDRWAVDCQLLVVGEQNIMSFIEGGRLLCR
jgi:hypothetical protein